MLTPPKPVVFEAATYAAPEDMPPETRARYETALAAKVRRRTAWIMGTAFVLLVLMVFAGMIYIVVNGGQVDRFGRMK